MKIPLLRSLLVVLFTLAPLVARSANIDYFHIFNFDHRNDGTVELPGRLLVPEPYDPNRSYPLFIHFHGIDHRGTNNTSQIAEIGKLIEAARNPDHPFFLYVPQLPSGSWPGTAVDRAMRMLSRVSAIYNIDQSRIYVTGISLGGGGVWDSLSRYAGALAGGVPIAGVEHNPNYSLLVGKPIWIFHGVFDSIVNVQSSRNRVNGMRAAQGLPTLTFPLNSLPPNDPYYNNGPPLYATGSACVYDENRLRYTEFTQGGHTQSFWDRCLSDPNLLPWLFANPNPLSESSLQINESILFDFGANRVNTANGLTWNGTTSEMFDTPGTAIAFGKNSTGRITIVSLDINRRFAGDTSGGSTALYPNNIGTDGWHTPEGMASELAVRGLLPNGIYRLEIYASHPDSDGGRGRRTRYTVGKESRELEAYGNTTGQAVFEQVQANARGEIHLTVAPAPGGTEPRFGQINVLKVTYVAAPAPTDALFEQSFNNGDTPEDYVGSSPSTFFETITAAPGGGQWSIVENTLRLQREAAPTPAGPTAGFLRLSQGDSPQVLTARFTLSVDLPGIHTFGTLGVLELGDFTTPDALEASPANTSQALQIRGNGTGRFRLAIGELPFGNFAGGETVEIAWMINHSNQPQEYMGLDGKARTLSPHSSDVWVNGALLYDNRPAPENLQGEGLGGLRFRTTTPYPVAFSFHSIRLEEGLPQYAPFFRQDFSGSTHYRDYIDPANPGFDKFHDISAEPEGGGTWSIVDGKLQLLKSTTSTTPNNAAGFTRVRLGQPESWPEVICARFNMIIDKLGSYYFGNEGFLEFGDFPTVTDYSNAPSAALTSEQIVFRGAGTDRFYLQMNGVNYATYDSGTPLAITWIINRSNQNHHYLGLDGIPRIVSPKSSDVWVGNALVVDNQPSNPSFTGTRLGAFRFRTPTPIAIKFQFDSIEIESRLPQAELPLPLQADSFASWQAATLANLPPEQRGPDADPDADRLPNLLEYALDLDPTRANTRVGPSLSLQSTGPNDYLALSFVRPVDKPDITYLVEASGDLVNWTQETTLVAVDAEGDAYETVSVRDNEPYTGSQPRYLRLRVTDGDGSAVTRPAGVLPLAIPGGGATRKVSVPLLQQPVYHGQVGSISGDRITVPGAAFGPLAEPNTPHFLRFTSGEQAGRVLRIVANTEETVTLDLSDRSPQATPLQGVPNFNVVPGDRFEILPAHTLGSLLGTHPDELPIQGGPNAFLADTVQLWNGAASRYDTYFFNTSLPTPTWTRSGSTDDSRHQPILPGDALVITTKAGSPGGVLEVAGEVPAGRFLVKTAGNGTPTPVGHPFPVAFTLAEYADDEGPFALIQKGANAFLADTLQIYNPSLARDETFFRDLDGVWRLSGDQLGEDHSSKPVEPGSAVILIKKAPVSGAASFLSIPQPAPGRYQID